MPASTPKRAAPKSTKRSHSSLTRALSASSPIAENDALTPRVRAALADVPEVREKKMFGSTGFMVRGKLCITARATRLMLRIDPANHEAAIKRKVCTTVVMRGRPCRGYVFVDASAVKTARTLNPWLKQALDFNERTFG